MARNVEIKARVDRPARLRERVEAMADQGPVRILQEDVFFRCDSGRLKLRKLPGGEAELIHYQRDDSTEPRESDYVKTDLAEPGRVEEALARALGVIGRVRKEREVFLRGRTRIHLDRVEGLGDYLELEVVLSPEESIEAGVATARRLMRELEITPEQVVDQAYIDLLAARDL